MVSFSSSHYAVRPIPTTCAHFYFVVLRCAHFFPYSHTSRRTSAEGTHIHPSRTLHSPSTKHRRTRHLPLAHAGPNTPESTYVDHKIHKTTLPAVRLYLRPVGRGYANPALHMNGW
ncbi:hypothetical protein BDY19DRAFT_4328 [Irpex rosettiformis]|uniref:Uncharacterized protein n=1 Tax=Irpex rosettiformis TaxID=378272 RepID=A0ACB8UJ77_9APHY|nr:hypothetical protein BDY19DRAFT_4328 [Irpex rosettiformis]